MFRGFGVFDRPQGDIRLFFLHTATVEVLSLQSSWFGASIFFIEFIPQLN